MITPHEFKTEVKTSAHIYIQPQAVRDIQAIIHLTDKEVGMFGLCRKHASGLFEIYEILLPKQEVAAHTCEISSEGLGEVAESLISDRPDEYDNLRVWFHSHHTMSVGPSGQDDKQWAELSENCNDYFIRGICNKKGRLKLDINMIDAGYVIEDAPWSVIIPGYDNTEKWKAEFEEKCKPMSYTQTGFGQDWWYNKNRTSHYATGLYNRGWRTVAGTTDTLERDKIMMTVGIVTYNEIWQIEAEGLPSAEAQDLYDQGWRTTSDGWIRIRKGTEIKDIAPDLFTEIEELEEDHLL